MTQRASTALLITLALLSSTALLSAAAAAPAATTVTPAAGTGGWHRGPVDVRVDAAETYRLDDGPWLPVADGQVIRIAGDGTHVLEHRAGDAPPRSTFVRIDGTAPELSLTATTRERGRVVLAARARDATAGAQRVEVWVDRGRWRSRSLEEVLFDGSAASLRNWQQAGTGSFALTDERTLRTVGGLGMLWYAAREFGDAALRLQWREARPDGVHSNGGVFARFPGPSPVRACDVLLPPALTDVAWHAVACGHELQINDGDIDPQRTGSVYAFRPLGPEDSPRAPFGEWNDFEVRTVGGGAYELSVVRNGTVVNRFVNTPGQSPATPEAIAAGQPRVVYPGTDVKQFARGFFGLQNHGDADVIDYRDVRVLPLEPRSSSIGVTRSARRRRTVRVRAVDAAGNRSAAVTLRIARRTPRG
jgi:hypothetical protein